MPRCVRRAHTGEALSIFKNMVHHSSDQVCVCCHHHCVCNGSANTHAGSSRFERALYLH